MSRSKFKIYRGIVSSENHPELLPQGEGIKRVTSSKTKEASLKIEAIKAKAALDIHRATKSSSSRPKKVRGK